MAGKVWHTLAMRHRLSGVLTYGLMACDREMSTLPMV